MRHTRQPSQIQRGFTLIELMIAIAVAALLAAIALPAYQDSMRKGRRAEAVAGLTQLQQAQERHRANNTAYAANFAAMAPQPASATEHYNLTIDASGAADYQVTAAAKSGSPQFGDTKCRGLRVVMSGGNLAYQSLNAGGTVDATNTNRCWAR